MTRRKQTKHYLTSFPWQQIYIGFLVLAMAGFVHMIPKPVPDTKGVEYLVSTALCTPEHPAQVFVVPQTTEAVNVTIVSLDNTAAYSIPKEGVLRQQLPCTDIGWGHIAMEAIFLTATREVSLYVEYKSESHVVFPMDTLGSEHIVSQIISPELQEAFILISGNNSNVELTLPNNLNANVTFQNVTYAGGTILNFTLNEYGTAAISCSCDLTGASIVSSGVVSVLVGSRNSQTAAFIVDQLPPASVWGRRLIWPGHPWIAQNVTLKIIGRPSQPTSAIVTLKGSTQTLVLPDGSSSSMQLQVDDFISVESNASVLCSIAYDIHDLSGSGHTTFRFLTPLLLYHVSSTFAFSANADTDISASLILSANSYQYISMDSTQQLEFSKRPMTYYWSYFILRDVSVKSPYTIRTSDTNKVPFYSNVLRRDNDTAFDYTLGMRITGIYDKCVKAARAHGGNGDGVDNDCDNKIDEERLNSADDDGDKRVDEDICYSGVIKRSTGDMAWEYIMKNRETETGISTSVILVIISIVVSVMSVGCFIGGMLLTDKIRRVISGTRVNPIANHR